MKRGSIAVVAVLLAGCGGTSSADRQLAVDTLTRAQKDSIIADMPIPGAGAVGRALDAAGNANARTEQHDSIGR